MIDWLVIWGVQQLSGFAFRTILEQVGKELGDLTKGAAEDFVKDFFKDCLKSGLKSWEKDPLAEAMGKAYAQFLYLIQQELEAEGSSKAEIETYNTPLEKFIREKAVKQWLGKAFTPGCQSLDERVLRENWRKLELKSLPKDFSWKRISRLYLNRVEDIIGESQELKELFSAKQLKDIADNTQHIAGIIPDFDIERYRETIQETYRSLKLSKIDTTDGRYQVKLWKIFIPQTVREALPPSRYELPKEVVERLQDEGAMEADFSAADLASYQDLFFKKPVKSVLDIVQDADCPYTVFLGDPGAGKSTLLQYLALDWAENPTARLPLLIELRDYIKDENSPKNFLGFFHLGKRKICELNEIQLDEQLNSGNALVMFDGLDEIFDNDIRERVITEIHAFTNKYPQVKVIVTSRIIGYNHERLRDAGFRPFTLHDFDESQIREFIQKWHKLALIDESEQECTDLKQRLQTAIKDSPAIRQLAGNPLLLTMMAILNRRKELPRRRIDLYEESTNVLLYQWEIEYKKMELTLDDVDLRAKQAMLRLIAYEMQASEKGLKGNIIHRDDLENLLAGYLRLRDVSNPFKIAGKIIEQLRKRDFILCHLGKDYYGFVHRTFLEYFCATAIKERFDKRGKPEGLSIEQLKGDIFGQHWQDKSWHEVLRLISGTIDAEFVAEVMEYLIDIYRETSNISPLILAAECFNEVDSKVKLESASERLLKALQGALETDNDKYTIAKTITLYWQDNPAVMDWLEEIALNHQESSVRQGIAQGIAAITLPHVDNRNISITDIADVYCYQNQYEKAISAYLRGVDLTFVSQYGLRRTYTNLKRFDEAIAHYQQSLKKNPKDKWAYDGLGYTYREAGCYEEAVETFNRVIEIAGKNQTAINYLKGLGWTYQDWGKYDKAIEVLNRAVNIEPKNELNSNTYSNLGLVYDDLGQYDEAIAAYKKAIAIDPKNAYAYNNLGCLYRIREQWEDATDAFYNAIQLNSQDYYAYHNLGIVYLLKGDFTQAKQAFTTSIKLDSRYGGAILNLGILQALQGDIKQAQTTWQKGLEIYPEYPQDARLFRTIYTIGIGETQQGLNTLQQILNQEKPPVGLLRYVLETAHLLQRCLPPIAGINEAVEMIKEAGIIPPNPPLKGGNKIT